MSGDKPEDKKDVNSESASAVPVPPESSVSKSQDAKSAPPPAPPKSNSPKDKAAKPKRSGVVIALLALLIAILALALAAWQYQQEYLLAKTEASVTSDLKAELQTLSASQTELVASFAAQREALAQLRLDNSSQLSALSRRSQELETKMQSLTTVDRQDWLLAEVEYLLRLANQRAQLSHDPRAAAQLLSNADSILRELDDAALHPVRAELAKEISALQNSADVDIEGVYLTLQGLATEAGKLKLYQAPSYSAEEVEETSEEWQQRLQSGLDNAWAKLRSYIRIRHHDQNFKAQLAPEQEAALRASLRLMFEQAQLALLANRPLLYQRALDKAAAWLQEYYQLDDHRDGLLKQISTVRAMPVSPEMADISGSLRSLKVYLKSHRWQQEARK
ncbi:uroporphyrin-3 C-methyltransferase [Zhongshania antarctica]|uniref:Uroporphyrin-3 C-methyltransferase n=1 Tax=Zhongshania antarctica TaxID=641702 RepID=A0A840R1V5_9GAMM|nr:uroporphyrinogen-III C-methyltransferase [Zhongshania antarctica]MBB5186618.1 uroporphyrin-3 C-methyltransferase [Zhongshania antarctica]